MIDSPPPRRPLVLAAISRLGIGVGALMAVGGGALLPDALDDLGDAATGVVALACGLGLAGAFYTAEREAQLDERARLRHPHEPWRLLRGWTPFAPSACAAAPITRLAVIVLLLSSIAAAALTVVAFWQAATIQVHPADILWGRRLRAAKVASALMPAVTVGLVAALLWTRRRLVRLESIRLSLDAVPVLPGRHLSGELVTSGRDAPIGLRLIVRRDAAELLRAELPLGPPGGDGRQAFSIPIPAGLPGSSDPGFILPGTVQWRAEALLARPESEEFVFVLPASSEAAFGAEQPGTESEGDGGRTTTGRTTSGRTTTGRGVWPALSPSFLARVAGILALASLALRVGCSTR